MIIHVSSVCDTVSTSPDESYVKFLKLEAYCQKTMPTIKLSPANNQEFQLYGAGKKSMCSP